MALVVIFNQDFSRNVPKLESIYGRRFRDRYYLVPDYWSKLHLAYVNGSVPQQLVFAADLVISITRRAFGRKNPFGLTRAERCEYGSRLCRVCGHQFFFYHFLYQSAHRLLDLKANWYVIVGDDALLNPALDEESFQSFLGMNDEKYAVLCKPVVGSDQWITKIAGYVETASEKLRNVFGSVPVPGIQRYSIAPDIGAEKNIAAVVSCADFFALRRDLFEALMPTWRHCFLERIYVEMAVPNAVLNLAKAPLITDKFVWQQTESHRQWKEVCKKMLSHPAYLFCHPVKLSAVELHELAELTAMVQDRR
ncbi:MAG: hypothetical protein L0287_28890 [Anaerolineae bacterium]|nr:hypothetical protein [Anaerolineae bacterium]